MSLETAGRGSAICGLPALPCAAGQIPRRHSDDGEYRRHLGWQRRPSRTALAWLSPPRWLRLVPSSRAGWQGSGTAGASPRGNATCIKVVWLAARRRCAKVRALPCGDHRDASPVCLWGEGSRGCAPPVEWSGHLMKSARSERWQLPRHSSSGDGPEARAARATAS
jgi:hypothetical protein